MKYIMKSILAVITALAMMIGGGVISSASATVYPTRAALTEATPTQPPGKVKLRAKAKVKFKKAVRCGAQAARHEKRTAPPADPSVRCLSKLKGKKFWAVAFQKCTPPAEGYARASAMVSQRVIALSVAKSMAPNSRVTARNKIVDVVFAKTEVELVCSYPPITPPPPPPPTPTPNPTPTPTPTGNIDSLDQPNDVVWCNARTIKVEGVVTEGQTATLRITAGIGTVSFDPLSCEGGEPAVRKQDVTGNFTVKFWYLAPTEGRTDTVTVSLFSSHGIKWGDKSVSFGLTKPPVDPL